MMFVVVAMLAVSFSAHVTDRGNAHLDLFKVQTPAASASAGMRIQAEATVPGKVSFRKREESLDTK
jgi:hypothetical protein